MTPLVSILIPSLPERLPVLSELIARIGAQGDPRMEVLVLMDNRQRQVGAKRNLLMQMARGKYLAHIDDDDLVSADYFQSVLPELGGDADVIGYDAGVSFNGGPEFRVTTSLEGPNQQPHDLGGGRYSDITRTYWHWSLWRTDFALRFKFPEEFGWTEDAVWLAKALPEVTRHRKINKILFHHRWSASATTFPAK